LEGEIEVRVVRHNTEKSLSIERKTMKPANFAPMYACIYPEVAEICRAHGYALAAHGSLAADFDVIAIPWIANAADPDVMVDAITTRFSIKRTTDWEQKEHGRCAITLSFSFGTCRFDFSVMPRVPAEKPT
jgi:hypothetical protein